MRVRRTRIELDRTGNQFGSFTRLAALMAQQPEEMQGVHGRRLRFQHSPADLFGLIVLAGTMQADGLLDTRFCVIR